MTASRILNRVTADRSRCSCATAIAFGALRRRLLGRGCHRYDAEKGLERQEDSVERLAGEGIETVGPPDCKRDGPIGVPPPGLAAPPPISGRERECRGTRSAWGPYHRTREGQGTESHAHGDCFGDRQTGWEKRDARSRRRGAAPTTRSPIASPSDQVRQASPNVAAGTAPSQPPVTDSARPGY